MHIPRPTRTIAGGGMDHAAEFDHAFGYTDLTKHSIFRSCSSATGVEEDLGGFTLLLQSIGILLGVIVLLRAMGLGRLECRAKDGKVR